MRPVKGTPLVSEKACVGYQDTADSKVSPPLNLELGN